MPNPLDTLYDQLKGQYPDLVDRSEFIGKLSNEDELKKLHDAASKDIPGFVDFDNFKSKVGESLSTYDQDSDYKAQSAPTEQESAPTDITIPRREKGRHVPSEPQNGGISSEAYVPTEPGQPIDTRVEAEPFDRETGDLDELDRRYQEKVKRLEGYGADQNLYVNEDEARKHYEAYSRLFNEAEQDRLVYNRRAKAADDERAEQQRQLDLQSKDRKTRRSAEYGGYTNDQVRKEQERLKKERAYLEDPKSKRNADYSKRVMEYKADQTALSGEADKRNKRAERKRAMYDEVRKVAEDPDVQKRITGNDTVTYVLSGNNTYALQNYDAARERAKTMSDEELVEHCKSIAGQKYARGDNKDIYAPLAAAFMAYHNELMYRLGGDEPKSALEMRYDMIDKATESSPEGDNFMLTLRNYLDGTAGMGTANFENDQSERANIPQFAVVDYYNALVAQKEDENMTKVEQIARYPQQEGVTDENMAAAANDISYDKLLEQAFERFGNENLKAYITAYALRNGISIDEAARRVNQSIWDDTIGKTLEGYRPKSGFEFFVRRIFSDNMFAKLGQLGLRARNGTLGTTDPFAMSSMALDEYAKDHPVWDTAAVVTNFAVLENPIFSVYGKVASGLVGAGERAIIGAATKTAEKTAIESTAKALNQSFWYRLAKGVPTGALTGFQYGTMSGAIDQAYYDGNVNFGKVIANGGHMARDFAIMHGVGELFGVTGDAILRRGQRNLRNGQGVLRNRLETTSLHFLNNVAKTTTNASIVTGLYAAIDKPALERENKKIEAENKKIEAENARLPEDKQKPLKPLNQIASVEDTFYSSLRMFAGLDAVGMLRRAWSIGVRGDYERNKHVKIHFDKFDREALEKAFGKNPNSLLRQIVFGNVDGVPAKWFEIDPEAEAEIYKELGRELTPAEKEAYATYGFTELRKVILNKDIPWATRAKIVSVVTGRIVQEPPVARGDFKAEMDSSGTQIKRIIVKSLDMEGNVIQAREFGEKEFEAARSLYESLNDRGWRNNALLCGNLVIDAIEDKTYADTVDEMAREKGIAPDQFEQMVFGIKQKDITGEKVTYQERQLVDEFDKRHQQKQQAETELSGPNKLFEQIAREVFGAEWKRALNIPRKSWGEMSEGEKEFVNRYIERIGAMGVAERNKQMNSNPDWARAAKEYEESVRRRMAEAERPAEAEPLPALEDEKVSVEVPAEERVEPTPEVIELEEEPGKEQPTQSAGPQDTPTPVEERPAEPASPAKEKPATVEPEQPMTEEKPQAGTIGFEPVEQPTERERYDAERKAKAATITDADIEANREALGIPEGTALSDETRQIYAEDLAEDLMRYERYKRGESDEKARFHDYWESKFNPERPKLEKPAEKQEEPVEEEEREEEPAPEPVTPDDSDNEFAVREDEVAPFSLLSLNYRDGEAEEGTIRSRARTRKQIGTIAKALGYKIRWVADKPYNAKIDTDEKVLYLNIRTDQPLAAVMGHEVTHDLRKSDPKAYEALKRYAQDLLGQEQWDSEVKGVTDDYNEEYKRRGWQPIRADKAEEEVVCDTMGKLLHSRKGLRELAGSLDTTVAGKVYRLLKDISDKVKTALGKEQDYSVMDTALQKFLESVEQRAKKGMPIQDAPVEETSVEFSLRKKPAPKNTGVGYKVFYLKDGKLYPPMVANIGGEATPFGVWLDADAAPIAGKSKTGRNKVKAGGKGTQGGSGTLAYRPGWHLGKIPYALQFNRGRKVPNPLGILNKKGKVIDVGEFFPNDFVWAEVEYAADKDYQEEAHDYGVNANGKYNPSLAGLPRVPEDGSYEYRTNPNPATDPWIITGAMKVNRILKPSEVDEMVRAAGREPQKRQEGAFTDEQIDALNKQLNNTIGNTARNIQGLDGYTEQDVLDGVRGDIENKLNEAGVDGVTIKGMALHGSRMRGDARADSDLDVVVEYEGNISEDGLFNILNDEPMYFDGVKVDINPITRGKSGTLEQYMERSRRYDKEKLRDESSQSGTNFSLKREDDQKVFDTAKRKFGETKDIREAGYVLPDGSMLDFSGRHELDPGTDSSFLAGSRTTDHRAIDQISFVYDENGDEVDTGVSSDMPDFIKRGAIRIDANNGLINLSTKPTPEQRKVLRQLVAEHGGTVDVDFGDGWDTAHSAYYDNTNATRILGDIDRYFDEGIKPEGNVRFSLKKETRTDADGNEVYTETREDGTKDREITTYGDGSKKALWYDDKGNLKERLDYFPDGEVSQVANYDNSGNITRHIQYDENRHITSYYLPAIGTDWKLDENGIARGKSNGVEIKPYNFQFSLKREQTHSANFKNWFGDWENDPENASKVVDVEGKPKVVLHGTPNGDFYVFDPEKAGSNTDQGWLGTGFYFYGNAPEYASQYAGKNGRVLQVYLDIKNPYIASVEEFNRLAEANDPEMSRRFREQLEDEGYDGVYYNGDLNEEWVAFRPEQIKSATENNGDFDPNNPDIRFSLKRRRNRDDYTDEDRADAAIIANTYLAQADALRQQIEADREQEHRLVEERNKLLAFDYPAADPADRPAIMDRINALRNQINDLRNANYENNTKLRSMDYEYRVAKEILEQGAVTDEEAARFDAGQMTREEQVLESLFKAAADSRADKKAKQKAIRGLVRELAAITDNFKAAMKARGIESQRKQYDKGTVDHIIRLAKAMMGTGYIDNMTSYEVKRLMGMINNAATRESIETQASRIVDMMLDHQIKTLRNDFNKQLKVTGQKTNSSGVQVQAGLDQEGQVVMEAMRKSMQIIADSAGKREETDGELTEWGEFYNKILNDMGDADPVKAEQARKIFTGILLAERWFNDVRTMEINDRILRSQMEDFKASNKPAKDADADTKRRYNDALADYQEMIRQNKIKIIEAYERMTGDVGMTQADSMRRAKEFADAQKQRVEDIQHNANSDLQDVDDNTQVETPESRVFGANKNNVLARLLFASAGTYEKFMRFFGRMAPNGEGYLFKRFMTQYTHARKNYWKGRHSAFEEMDKKMAEVFGKKKMHWSDIYEMTRDHKKFPPIQVSYWDGYRNGQPRLRMDELNQSEALYLYMINKMPDGRMKLRKMGITDDVVQQMAGQIDGRLIQLADWLQGEFLPKMRIKYNETHKRVFGADMAAIEDYFPLRINRLARTSDKDITQRDADDNRPSTITGAIVKRRVNTKPIDLHTDAFDVALSHIDEMEHWSAYAEFNRDNNTLVNYNRFSTKVNNMRSLEFGAGDVLWKNFTDAVAIAADAYHPRAGSRSGDHYATRVARFVSTAKIALRSYTALKQLLSIPAFWADSDPLEQMKATVNVANTWQWAIENLPGFAERWQSKQAGNIKLANYNDLSGLRRRKAMQMLGRAGMWANAAIDGLACAMGGKAVYETKLKRYRKMGYDEARAQEKALIDAAVAYNNSQQSSEGAYVSPLQVDRTWFANAFSVFRSASMGYTRRMNTSLRQLRNATFKPGYGAKSVEFLKKQMMRDGLTEEQAEKWAHRIYRRANLKAAASVAIFGQILPFTWNLGANMFYLLFGDDDKEKLDILADSFRHSFFGPVEGLTGGNVISELGDIAADTAIGNIWGDSVWGDSEAYKTLGYREFSTMPLSSDLSSLLKYFARDEVKAANEVVNILFQVATGVNPQTITDWATAILDLSRSDIERRDIAMFAMRLLSTPQSQLDKFYLDQMNISQEQADKMSVDDLIKRYATYKRWRETPLTGWMYSDEREKEVEEKFQKRYEEMLEERSVAEDGLRGSINDIKDLPRKRTMMQKLQKELTDSIEAADPDLYKKALEGEKADDDEYVRHVTDKDVEQMAELQMKKKALYAAHERKKQADKDRAAGRITKEEYDAIYKECAHQWKLYNYLNGDLPKKLKEMKLKMEPDAQSKHNPEYWMDSIRTLTDEALRMRPEDMKMKKGDKKKVKKNKKK